jgi:hypothetical protein
MWIIEYYKSEVKRSKKWLLDNIKRDYGPEFLSHLKSNNLLDDLEIESSFEKCAENYINNSTGVVIRPTKSFFLAAAFGRPPRTLIEPAAVVMVDLAEIDIEVIYFGKEFKLMGFQKLGNKKQIIIKRKKTLLVVCFSDFVNEDLESIYDRVVPISFMYHIQRLDSVSIPQSDQQYKIKEYKIGDKLGASMAPSDIQLTYDVSGHWRMQPYGSQRSQRKLIYINEQVRKRK